MKHQQTHNNHNWISFFAELAVLSPNAWSFRASDSHFHSEWKYFCRKVSIVNHVVPNETHSNFSGTGKRNLIVNNAVALPITIKAEHNLPCDARAMCDLDHENDEITITRQFNCVFIVPSSILGVIEGWFDPFSVMSKSCLEHFVARKLSLSKSIIILRRNPRCEHVIRVKNWSFHKPPIWTDAESVPILLNFPIQARKCCLGFTPINKHQAFPTKAWHSKR